MKHLDVREIESFVKLTKPYGSGKSNMRFVLTIELINQHAIAVKVQMPVVLKSSMRTEKLVEAATKLFARQGYHRTSTRQ